MTDKEHLLNEKYGVKETEEYFSDLKRLEAGEPLAYLIGSVPFLGLTIHLDSRPLIPRPETEWWTEELIKPLSGKLRFLDLCAGSGAIGCAALARLPNAEVYFGEVDPAHEPTILKNIRESGLDATRAVVGIGDLFEPFQGLTFDVIAINPPYIPSGRHLDPSVGDYEPHRALFSGEDGLDLMRRIAAELPKHLNNNGVAWIECDSEHAEAARDLFEAAGLTTTIRTDQYDRPRILVVSSS